MLFLTTLYHLSVPVRTSWRYDVPGATLALSIWIFGSWLLRVILQHAGDSTSIYGPLAAPIAVLLWLYLTSIAVLIGAALNSAFDQVLAGEGDRPRPDGARPPGAAPASEPATSRHRRRLLSSGPGARREKRDARLVADPYPDRHQTVTNMSNPRRCRRDCTPFRL